MFIKSELEIIKDAISHCLHETKVLATRRHRAQMILSRVVEHIDYLCDDCGGTGIGLKTSEVCEVCKGSGKDPKWEHTTKAFGPPEIVRTGVGIRT